DSKDLSDVYCNHILEGRLPQLIPDTSKEPLAVSMPITQAVPIGSHVSIPIQLDNGETYGMFCCLSPTPNATLNERDLSTMKVFGDLAAQQVNRSYAYKKSIEKKKARIQSVIDRGAFSIVYQPIFNIVEMAPVGYESLCRFADEPYRTPDVWFNEAAEVGLALELELAAIQSAISAVPNLEDGQYISVNASPNIVVSDQFRQMCLSFPLDRVVLEITEHSAVENYEVLIEALKPLRDKGMKLAIDDAGAGHSSLRHIIQIHPDLVKIDMSLTQNVDLDLARRALIGALVFYSRETSAQIIAEGIETEKELETLRLLGVSKGQGYFLGRPSKDFAPLEDTQVTVEVA
ncbi:MAG: EAL domain-containing protein, partial [Pseudomonadota bacterium]